MNAKVGGKCNGSAEAEDDAQSIHGNIHHGNAELVDEGGRDEVQQGEQPPYAYEEAVVDDGGHARVRAGNIVTHETDDNDSADELPCSETQTERLHFGEIFGVVWLWKCR